MATDSYRIANYIVQSLSDIFSYACYPWPVLYEILVTRLKPNSDYIISIHIVGCAKGKHKCSIGCVHICISFGHVHICHRLWGTEIQEAIPSQGGYSEVSTTAYLQKIISLQTQNR